MQRVPKGPKGRAVSLAHIIVPEQVLTLGRIKLLSKLREFLESQPGLLILGFVLTTLLGTILNYAYHDRAWKQEKRVAILTSKLTAQGTLIDSIASLTSERAFWMHRVQWAIEENDSTRVEKAWGHYYERVVMWNSTLRAKKSAIHRLANKDLANSFFEDEEDRKLDIHHERDDEMKSPMTVHGSLKYAHILLLELRDCVKDADECRPSLRDCYGVRKDCIQCLASNYDCTEMIQECGSDCTLWREKVIDTRSAIQEAETKIGAFLDSLDTEFLRIVDFTTFPCSRG